jgi:hypothetical protein
MQQSTAAQIRANNYREALSRASLTGTYFRKEVFENLEIEHWQVGRREFILFMKPHGNTLYVNASESQCEIDDIQAIRNAGSIDVKRFENGEDIAHGGRFA